MAAPDIVIPIIEDARNYASQMISEAQTLVQQAVTAASGGVFFNPPTHNTINQKPTTIDSRNDPGVFTGNFVAPTDDTTMPTLVDGRNIEIPEVPLPPAALDTSHLFTTAKPSFDISQFTEQPPNIDTTFNMPPNVVTVFPDPPPLISINLPNVTLPTIPTFNTSFNGTVPQLSADPVQTFRDTYATMLPQMRSFIDSGVADWMSRYAPRFADQLDQLESKIATGMPGGAAFDTTFEQALYDRHRDRIHAEQNANYQQATENASKRGFLLPQGVLTTLLQEVQKASSDRVAVAATEVNIERRKLELQHLQFVMTISKDIRQIMLTSQLGYAQTLVNVNGQALEAAKAIAGLIIETFNAMVRLFTAQLEQYKTEAFVFEARLKAALATLEVYKVQVEVEKAKVDLNRALIESYTARIHAEEIKVRTYVAQVDALRVKAELQKLKLEIFSEKIKAYIARVQMKEAESGAYKASIDGDRAIVDAYASMVQAYRIEIDAAKAKIDAQVSINDAISRYNSTKIQAYTALLEKVKVQIQVELSKFEAQAKAYDTRLELYKTDIEVQVRKAELDVQVFKANVEQMLGILNQDVNLMISSANVFVKQMDVAASTAVHASGVLAGIAQSAVGSLNNVIHLADETTRSG